MKLLVAFHGFAKGPSNFPDVSIVKMSFGVFELAIHKVVEGL